MFNNSASANSQPQAQDSQKNRRLGGQQESYLIMGVNSTKVAKKDKDKAKDLSYIKRYTYKYKDHYANKLLNG